MNPDRAPSLILTLNSGSSSLKAALYRNDNSVTRLDRTETTASGEAPSQVLAWLERAAAHEHVDAVAHRVVHGGEEFSHPCVVTPAVLSALQSLVPLARNHLPSQLKVIAAFREALPNALHVASFDTAFHHALPDAARVVPVGSADGQGLRRFGFHGLSYTFLLSELDRLGDSTASQGRVVLAHLGSGASLAAVRNGTCIDTTMGLTPSGGLVMSTRPGDLDPGVVTFLMRTQHLSVDAMDEILTTRSGLAALSGGVHDMKALVEMMGHDPAAKLAVDVFCYSVVKGIGAMTAVLGGIDTLVFSAGIGERSAVVRARVCDALSFLDLRLDTTANAGNCGVISQPGSRVTVRVIPTDEAVVMARDARTLSVRAL